jgi:hypothetical protein
VKNMRITLFFAVFASLMVASTVLAQTGQLTLRMSRDWGYGGFNGDIEGLFSMHVTGPADLVRVEYYIDNTKIGEITRPPFTLQFNTEDYQLGNHRLSVIGYSTSGQEYRSNVIATNFVPKQSSLKIIIPILSVVVVAILLSTLVPLLNRSSKRPSTPLGTKRNYGAGGGGICPKCHRPFALPLFSAHLGFFKLAPCPFCGKWSLVRVESIDKLREAEKAELEWGNVDVKKETEEEKSIKELDDSKYQDL